LSWPWQALPPQLAARIGAISEANASVDLELPAVPGASRRRRSLNSDEVSTALIVARGPPAAALTNSACWFGVMSLHEAPLKSSKARFA